MTYALHFALRFYSSSILGGGTNKLLYFISQYFTVHSCSRIEAKNTFIDTYIHVHEFHRCHQSRDHICLIHCCIVVPGTGQVLSE